ncbi:PREDICTED: solute carrier family 52, riboflavin transporter, member 3-A-like [Dufourea novaeangliae]|uniref:solute carrier family 52, riboflavin transporter, member 3-A-like n=1 Tax=Dufourea novaeangliae TaxID=178035 RepID=UPI0007673F93|nr:PREDICTED: solute carrier family 52, riboflavin transporter, member 3-A-like [Dufourea novaeangliae]
MTNVSHNSKERCKGKNQMIVHLLVTVFGISTWIGINGIYVQVPVLISTLPESWNLPAYLVLVIQAANVGPLLYTILEHFQWKINDSWLILCLLVSGSCAMCLLVFFYSEKTVINGNEYSLSLFILTFFNALVGCFSSVLFMPYLRNFNKNYLVSFFIGEGLSGVLPSVVALFQGIVDMSECTTYKNDTTDFSKGGLKFSSNDYFLFIFIVLFLSLTAFLILEYSSLAENVKDSHKFDNTVSNETSNELNNTHNITNLPLEETNKDFDHYNNDKKKKNLVTKVQYYLFLLLTICCFFNNGFFPSIQSYSCLPYGNVAYKLSITLAQFANPLVCLLAYWFVVSDIRSINYLSIICLAFGSYVTYLALMSPTPPLQETTLGVFLVVLAWTALTGFISYLKLTIVSVLRNTMLPKMLFKAGIFMQIGSASGAVLTFVAINFTNYFKMHDNCN